MTHAELTHVARTPIDLPLAERQHAEYRAALAEAGLAVIDLPALDGHPDCAFVEDAAIVLPQLTVLTNPGAASRRGEVTSIAAALPGDRPMATIAAPATLDGGDVLLVGGSLYVGLSTRTNEEAVAALRVLVEPYGYAVLPVTVSGALHLKTAVTALDARTVLINPAWIDAGPFSQIEQIVVAPDEPFGANVLRIGDRVLAQSSAPRTAARLAARGYAVATLDIGEFTKVEAGLTCLSIIGQ